MPSTSGYAIQGAGTASSTFSTNDNGGEAFDVHAQAASLDQNSAGASAVAIVGGYEQLAGNLSPENYVATITLSHVYATATGSGSGSASAQLDPGFSCGACNVTAFKGGGSIVSSLPNDGPLAPSRVSDATFTAQVQFTLQQQETSIQVWGSRGSTEGQANSADGLTYGSGHVELTGSFQHLSLNRVK